MNVVVDGIVFEMQSRGGVSRIFAETFPRLCEISNDISITLFTTRSLRQSLPISPCMAHRLIPAPARILRPSRFFGRLHLPVRSALIRHGARNRMDSIWHSTYYTMPYRWQGPVVVLVHDMIHEMFPELFNDAQDDEFRVRKKTCIEAADLVTTVSLTTKRDVQRIYGLDESRISAIHLAPSSIFKPRSVSGEIGFPYFLYVGGRVHYKNFALVLSAFHKWRERSDRKLLVVGDPWTLEETARYGQLLNEGHVKLLPPQSDESLANLYSGAEGLIYPSLYEGFGLPLVEAMASGCPIVASRIPSTEEVAADSPIYFDPLDEDGLVEALDVMLDPDIKRDCRRKGLERSRDFSWGRTAAELLAGYERALSE